MDDCPMCRAKDEDLARMREDNVSLREQLVSADAYNGHAEACEFAANRLAARVEELKDIAREMASALAGAIKGLDRMRKTGSEYQGGDISYLVYHSQMRASLKRAREAGIGEKDV